MAHFGVDYSWQPPTVAELRAAGVRFCVRYLSADPSQAGKNLTAAEAARLRAAGIDLVVVWQNSKGQAARGRAGGRADAAAAATQLRSVGGPAAAPVYFAVDFDVVGELATVLAYLDGAAEVLGPGRVGVYGEYDVVAAALSGGHARFAWQTKAWSGGRWYPGNHLEQYQHNVRLGSGLVDYDRAVRADFGQWSSMVWFPGADLSRKYATDGGSMVGGPPRVVWHDTETSGLPGYNSGAVAPHMTIDPVSGKVWQHFPADRAARALRNPSGGVQTNRQGSTCFQIEVIGWVNKVPFHPVMAEVAEWLERTRGVPRRSTVTWKQYPGSYGAGNGVRLSASAWNGYAGHLGHQHVPENDHGDPGAPFPIAKILAGSSTEPGALMAADAQAILDELDRMRRDLTVFGTTGLEPTVEDFASRQRDTIRALGEVKAALSDLRQQVAALGSGAGAATVTLDATQVAVTVADRLSDRLAALEADLEGSLTLRVPPEAAA